MKKEDKEKKTIDVEESEVKINTKPHNKGHKEGITYAVITFCACLLVFGIFYEFYLKNLVVETTKTIKDVTITDSGIADAVEKIYDSVVTVKNYTRGKLYSTGSGFVFKTDSKYGYILTNYHVISGGSDVSVVFTNNKEEKVNVVGYDEYSDIAVLAVEKDKVISVATTGSSKNMRIGDTTFAVGTPVDSSIYSWSVTRGILSGKNRMVQVDNYVMSVLQTDTAINSGNSGGPLCNANGDVIGINSMKLVQSQVEGMGFAIPIEDAISYANMIVKGEKIKRSYLGLRMVNVSSTYNFANEDIKIDSKVISGVAIIEILKDGPCNNTGLKKGDVITKIGDYKIKTVAELRYHLYKYKPNDKINIVVNRNGKVMSYKVTLGTSN